MAMAPPSMDPTSPCVPPTQNYTSPNCRSNVTPTFSNTSIAREALNIAPSNLCCRQGIHRQPLRVQPRSQRINRQLSPNCSLTRSPGKTVRVMEVLPILPGPMRAIRTIVFARPMIFSASPSRPNQALGGGGGNPPVGVL